MIAVDARFYTQGHGIGRYTRRLVDGLAEALNGDLVCLSPASITVLMGAYTAQNNEKVERLVLYAPSFIRTTPSPIAVEGRLGAYRTVTKEAAAKIPLECILSLLPDAPPGRIEPLADLSGLAPHQPAEPPVAHRDLLDQQRFRDPEGLVMLLQLRVQGAILDLALFAVARGDDDLLREQPVLQGVPLHRLLAGGGPRPGRVPRVSPVGLDPPWGGGRDHAHDR